MMTQDIRIGFWALLIVLASPAMRAESTVDFSRDIRPLLSDRCFKCHGFDEAAREADLALFAREAALGSGVIVPGDPDGSELIDRISTTDAGDVMPPPRANKPALTEAEIELFRRWIEQGAPYEEHWAFVPPRESGATPPPSAPHPIDAFVGRKLQREGLGFSPEADPHVLVRRLHLDLIGLPPTIEETTRFVRDHESDPDAAVEARIDDLLSRSAYGERWAREWLDLARYADTNGYEKDRERSMWPYRDWVIRALNDDLPYDRFTVEQIAGDMLPGATVDQRIATGFHRNTMLNEEGGIDPLEFRFHAMVDRVATTGTVWLGLTMGCAQCHTHKFDPITHTDFYAFMALMNNASEPSLPVPSAGDRRERERVLAEIRNLERSIIERIDPAAFAQWSREAVAKSAPWTVLRPESWETSRPSLEVLDDGSIFATGDFTKREVYRLTFPLGALEAPVTAIRIEPIPDDRLPGGGSGIAYYEGRPGDFFLSEVSAEVDGAPLSWASASVDYGLIETGFGTAEPGNVFDGDPTSGWATGLQETLRHELVLNLEQPTRGDSLTIELLFQRHFAAALGRFRISATSDPGTVEARGGTVSDLTAAAPEELMRTYLEVAPELEHEREQLAAWRNRLPEFPTAMVMEEWRGQTRPTHRHHRGDYVEPRERVDPGIPAVLGRLPEDSPPNRLTLAHWLASEDNPLAARVAVNRAWRAFFGRGLVATSGDYGYQSAAPSHPELLDYLAVDFMDRGWSFKKLHRLICTSRTYRQDSGATPELLARDPDNILLARGPRFRMTAEMIRDSALATSGLLVRRIGGPSVHPPQPPDVTAIAYGSPLWTSDTDAGRYRRSLYTFAKRTAPFAAYQTFDGPTGEVCVPRRDRSNTPLQALTLLNDILFVEAAQNIVFGLEDLDEETAATHLFRRILTRPPDADELAMMLDFYRSQVSRLDQGELHSVHLLGSDDVRLAAWMMTARALYNLDEAVTKG